MIALDPIAYFSSSYAQKADAPRQGSLGDGTLGFIEFLPGNNFEQALEDLEGMEKIWVLFWMHQAGNWKPKVQPPRCVKKKSVFATRSPHRPNPIGLSCVSLVSIKKRCLVIKDHDLLEGTPILDIKPYLPYADSFPNAKAGWIDDLPPLPSYRICYTDIASLQFDYVYAKTGIDLRKKIESRLQFFLSPSSSNRIENLGEGRFVGAYQAWRFFFQKQEDTLEVLSLFSGYKPECGYPSLEEKKLHEEFFSFFSKQFVRNE